MTRKATFPMSQNLPETGAVATPKPPIAQVLAQRATRAAVVAGDVIGWHILAPPSGSLRLTSEQIRDLQGLIRTYRDDSMGDAVACLESLWVTLVDRLNEGDKS